MDILVKCPKCAGKMKMIVKGSPAGAIKTCVYCGKSFCVHRNPNDSQIIKEIIGPQMTLKSTDKCH